VLTLFDVVKGGDLGVWAFGPSLDEAAGCAGRGLDDNFGVVGRRPLIVVYM
jgi:hypothetical protein